MRPAQTVERLTEAESFLKIHEREEYKDELGEASSIGLSLFGVDTVQN